MFPASMDMDIRLIDSIPMNKKGEIIMPFLLKMTIKKNIYDIWLALQAHLKKRASSFLLKKTRGSMTVEAAFVIPFFLFFMINILSIITMFMEYSTNLSGLHQQAKEMSVYAHLSQNQNEMVNMTKVQEIKSLFPVIAFPSSSTIVNCRIRKWTGYDATKSHTSELEEEWVYITETGKVYHRSRGCSYLNPSIHCVTKDNVNKKRNKSGEKYKPCKNCTDSGGLGLVYITEYGNSYHYTIGCSGLKRTIKTVPLSKVKHLGGCSKCG